MTSVLAQQLQALGNPGASLQRGKGRPSLLFEAHQAADIDLQTIYDIALQGACCINSRDVSSHSFRALEQIVEHCMSKLIRHGVEASNKTLV